MKRHLLFFTMVLLLSTIPQLAFTSSSVNVQVELTVFIESNSSVSVHELFAPLLSQNNANPTSLPLLFQAFIANNSAAQTAAFRFGIRRILENNTIEVLTEGSSLPFQLNPGTTGPITNISILSDDNPYYLQNVDITGAAEDLLSQILYTGKLPAGTYEFWVQVVDGIDGSQVWATDTVLIYIGTPAGNLALLYPGKSIENPDIQAIYTWPPMFEWQSNSLYVSITVGIMDGDQGIPPQNLDELTNKVTLSSEFLMNNGFLARVELGAGGASSMYLFTLNLPDLYIGEMLSLLENYQAPVIYWQVKAINESGSEILGESEIWRFKYINIASGLSEGENQQVISLLRNLLGEDRFNEIFEDENKLRGFSFTGRMFDKNGSPIDFSDLHEIYVKFLSGQVQLTEIIGE